MRLIMCALGAMFLAGCGEPAATVADTTDDLTPIVIQDRFRIYTSEFSPAETLERLLQSLDRRDMTVFAVIDHQAGAANVDLDMPPSILVIFGNPKTGTPLMVAEPLLGAELPMRALIYEENDRVMLAMTGADYLKREYNLGAQDEILKRIKKALETIADEVTAN